MFSGLVLSAKMPGDDAAFAELSMNRELKKKTIKSYVFFKSDPIL